MSAFSLISAEPRRFDFEPVGALRSLLPSFVEAVRIELAGGEVVAEFHAATGPAIAGRVLRDLDAAPLPGGAPDFLNGDARAAWAADLAESLERTPLEFEFIARVHGSDDAPHTPALNWNAGAFESLEAARDAFVDELRGADLDGPLVLSVGVVPWGWTGLSFVELYRGPVEPAPAPAA